MPDVQKMETSLLTNEYLPRISLRSQANELTAWTPAGLLLFAVLAHKYSPSQTLNRRACSFVQNAFRELKFFCSQTNSVSGKMSFPQFSSLFRLTEI